jgi:DNA-binding NtrC family response regulator
MSFKSVVLVDSNPNSATDVITSLKLANIAVTNATTAEEALRLLSEVSVGLMLVSTGLDGKRDGGVELVKKIASDERKFKTNIVMLVSSKEAPLVEPVRYVVKSCLEIPVKFPAFTNSILEILNSGAQVAVSSTGVSSDKSSEVQCCGVDLSSKDNPLSTDDERIQLVQAIQLEVLDLIRHSSVFRKAAASEVPKVVSEVTNSVCLRHAKRHK